MDSRELLLGRELVASELLRPEQLRIALEYQAQLHGRLEDILVKLDFIDEKRLSEFVAEREHMPTVDLSRQAIDDQLMARIPRELIESHEVLPFRLDDETVLLAMSDPTDYQVIDEVRFLTSLRVEAALAPRSELRERIERYYDTLPPPPPEPPPLAERLLARIADPTVQGLARVLLENGLVTPEEWEAKIR
jgi:type IV pilus assembly protein PilB